VSDPDADELDAVDDEFERPHAIGPIIRSAMSEPMAILRGNRRLVGFGKATAAW
jgi:hypothetical protein